MPGSVTAHCRMAVIASLVDGHGNLYTDSGNSLLSEHTVRT
jgi:hypothetical protein